MNLNISSNFILFIFSDEGFDFAFKINSYQGFDIYDLTYFKIELLEISRKWEFNVTRN